MTIYVTFRQSIANDLRHIAAHSVETKPTNAAIALYQNLARSQFSEAHSLLGGSRVAIQEKIDSGEGFTFSDLGLQTSGKFGSITSNSNASPGATTYSLVYTFSTGASPKLTTSSKNTVTYSYDNATGVWKCQSTVEPEFVSRCSDS